MHGPMKCSNCSSQRDNGNPKSGGQRDVRWTLKPNPRRRHGLRPRGHGRRQSETDGDDSQREAVHPEQCFLTVGGGGGRRIPPSDTGQALETL